MRASLLAMVLCAGCTVPESANPTPRCEMEADCTATEHCYRGLCVPDAVDASDGGHPGTSPDAGPPEPMCDDGKTWCHEHCVDTHRDDEHCGACGQGCSDDERCDQGRCEEKD